MKLYVACHSRNTARKLRDKIVREGHVCTSRWIDCDEAFERGGHSAAQKRRLAAMDEADVYAATDGLILITSPKGKYVPGGKHVETGMALAHGVPVYVLGRQENIFHWHPRVRVFSSCRKLLAHLRERRLNSKASFTSRGGKAHEHKVTSRMTTRLSRTINSGHR